MFVCKMRNPMKKTSTGILKKFCDQNVSVLDNKLFARNNHSVLSPNFYLLGRDCFYSLESKNAKYYTSILTRSHYLIKSQVRFYSENRTVGLPQLTSLPMELWPGIISPFSNLFLSYMVIKPFVDSTFDLREFVTASKQVVQVVSRKLASNDIDGLEEMMTVQTFSEIKQNLPTFSLDQRQELAIDQEDIYFTSPSAMIFRNDRENDKKSLQITIVHHVIRGMKDINLEGFTSFQDMQNPQQFQSSQLSFDENKAYILNYKFIREYSCNTASDWLLCGINHYKKKQIIMPGFPF